MLLPGVGSGAQMRNDGHVRCLNRATTLLDAVLGYGPRLTPLLLDKVDAAKIPQYSTDDTDRIAYISMKQASPKSPGELISRVPQEAYAT